MFAGFRHLLRYTLSHSKKMRIQFASAMASDSRLRELPNLSLRRTLKGNPSTTKSCSMFPLFGHFHYINQLRQILYKSSYCWFVFTHQSQLHSDSDPIGWMVLDKMRFSMNFIHISAHYHPPHHDAPAAANISGVTPSSSGSEARVARCSSIRCTAWVPAVMQPRWETWWDGLFLALPRESSVPPNTKHTPKKQCFLVGDLHHLETRQWGCSILWGWD